MSSVLDQEIQQDTSTGLSAFRLGGVQIEKERFYPATIAKVDFRRDEKGMILGWPPDKPRDGKQRHPYGTMKVVITFKVSEGDLYVPVPFPWSDSEDAAPWVGGYGVDGKLSGKPNTFTDEQVLKFRSAIRISRSGGMGHRLADWAIALGWQSQVIPPEGGEPKPAPFKPTWLVGKRCMIGKFRDQAKGIEDWIIAPPPVAQGDRMTEVNKMLLALKGQVSTSGEPLDDLATVCRLIGLPSSNLNDVQVDSLYQSLVATCQARHVAVGVESAPKAL
jgi:hypothetical protein